MIKTNSAIAIFKAVISGIFLIARDKFVISVNKMIYDNSQKLYETTYITALQTVIKNSKIDNDKLSMLSEMWLCFTELIILSALSIIAIFIKEKVFIIIFVLAIIAIFYENRVVRKFYQNKEKQI